MIFGWECYYTKAHHNTTPAEVSVRNKLKNRRKKVRKKNKQTNKGGKIHSNGMGESELKPQTRQLLRGTKNIKDKVTPIRQVEETQAATLHRKFLKLTKRREKKRSLHTPHKRQGTSVYSKLIPRNKHTGMIERCR
uniref:Uncharacterized protein n=1 Tax=Trypanosoma congolense (strain IL3000) TaxID=1068625 RepID=G0UZU7_TRYCI|nr:hypothetical protein, unlikely [Trypanosoma congolense IL3000]